MNEIAAAIAAAVEEQGAATQEIARNMQQAAAGTQDVSSNIAGVQLATGKTGESACLVRQGADQLSQQSNNLSSEVDAFFRTVRQQ